MKAERRTTQFGTARNPAAPKAVASQPSNLDGTLSHQDDPPGPPGIRLIALRRKLSNTAFFSHWLTFHDSLPVAPGTFSATRASPLSSSASAVSTASRTSPLVSGATGKESWKVNQWLKK